MVRQYEWDIPLDIPDLLKTPNELYFGAILILQKRDRWCLPH